MRHILVITNLADEMGQAMLRGVAERVFRQPGRWNIDKLSLTPRPDVGRHLLERPCEGIIVHLASQTWHATFEKLTIPVVNTSNVLGESALPRVCSDDTEAGAMAGRHLKDLGFSSALFCGPSVCAYTSQRLAGLRRVLGDDAVQFMEAGHAPAPLEDRLAEWFSRAQPPIALVGADDRLAVTLSRAASAAGLNVPTDAAVIGFDNDYLACELAQPTITSVELPFEQIGSLAASMLIALMDGTPPAQRQVRLPPIGVVERQSTSISVIPDAELRAVLALVEQSEGAVTVPELVRAVPSTQRSLELRFKKYLGKTPHQYLLHYRANRARRLLAQTRLTVTQVAMACHFSGATQMGVVFRRLWDTTPSAVRAAYV